MKRYAVWAALLIPVGCVVLGILTAVPVLFNFLGIALYVAILRECGRYVWPWRPNKIDNPSPPPPQPVAEDVKPQVTQTVNEFGNGAGFIVYPPGHIRRYDV